MEFAGSVIILDFAIKSSFFRLLGAFRLKRSVALVLVAVWMGWCLVSCGSSSNRPTSSGLTERVLASQGVTSTSSFGGLVFVNGKNDTLARVSELIQGATPSLMATSPTRNIVAAFDANSNNVFAINTVTEQLIGRVQLPGPTTSIVVPSATQTGYAAVPTATVTGYAFTGAVDVMNFAASTITTTIAVPNAQTVVANDSGSQLLVFSSNSSSTADYITVLSPGVAVPPVETSCLSAPNAVCTVVHGFDQPVYAVVSGSTAYVLNCGPQCNGTQASIAVLDLGNLTITNTIPVEAATWALLDGSTLYVAGTSPTNNACTGQTTAAPTCGRLDIVDLGSLTVTSSIVITDGYHDRMDLAVNGKLFVGSSSCTEIGNVNNPSGEVRGCLSIVNTKTGSVMVPPDNGDVTGLQGFTQRNVEYVAEGGVLRVYDTTKDILLINDFLPKGTINIVGNVGDVKAIDFF